MGKTETTIGAFNVKADKNGLTYTDTYDFKHIKVNPNSTFGRIRNYANNWNTSEHDPDENKIKFNIKREYTR